MAVDSSSFTLVDLALISNDPRVQYVSNSLLMNGIVLQDIPLTTYASQKALGVRWVGNLATVGYRKVNEEPAVTKSTPTPYAEQAYIISNNFDFDHVMLRDMNTFQDPIRSQMDAYSLALTYDVNDKFINNEHIAGDEDAPVGLKARLDNAADFGIPTEMKIDGAVDISAGSNGNAFIAVIQKALDFMGAPDGDGVVIYVNDYLRRKMDMAIRALGTAGGFDLTRDQFNRRVRSYNNAIFRDIGRKADQSTRVISETEANTGAAGSSTYTSMYFVRYGESYFRGWQMWDMGQAFKGPYDLPSGIQQRLNFDWPIGLWQEHIRSVARVYDIKIA